MNRYAIQGVLDDARRGKRVLYVGPVIEVRSVLDAAAHGAPDARRIYRANGRERIDFDTGGSVQFASSERGIRGMVADVVYLANPRDGMNDDMLASAGAAAQAGEVIRA